MGADWDLSGEISLLKARIDRQAAERACKREPDVPAAECCGDTRASRP